MLSCCSKLIASVFLLLFVLVTLVLWLLLNVDFVLLGSDLYKRALAGQNFYARLIPLAAEAVGQSVAVNPCGENRDDARCQREEQQAPRDDFVIKIIASARSDLKTCLEKSLGESVFSALANARRLPNAAEITWTKACVKKFGYPAGVTPSQGGMPLYMWILDSSDWEVILSALAPPNWLQRTIESVLDQFFAYLERKSDGIKISLVDLKSRLAGETGKTVFAQLLRAQPPCAKGQLAQIMVSSSGAERGELTICRPPDDMLTAVLAEIQKIASSPIANIPNEVDLTQNLKSPGGASSGEDMRDALGRARLFLRLSFLVPVILFALMSLFGVRSLGGLLRWWGVPLLMIGMIGGGMALLVWFGMEVALAVQLSSNRGMVMGLTAGLVQLGLDVAKHIVGTFTLWLGGEAVVVAGLGFVMILGSFIVERDRNRQLRTAA